MVTGFCSCPVPLLLIDKISAMMFSLDVVSIVIVWSVAYGIEFSLSNTRFALFVENSAVALQSLITLKN